MDFDHTVYQLKIFDEIELGLTTKNISNTNLDYFQLPILCLNLSANNE